MTTNKKPEAQQLAEMLQQDSDRRRKAFEQELNQLKVKHNCEQRATVVIQGEGIRTFVETVPLPPDMRLMFNPATNGMPIPEGE